MTEQEWMASADVAAMLAYLDTNVGERKARLCAICRCRQLVRFLPQENIKALDVSEMVADGMLPGQEFTSPGATKYTPDGFVRLLAAVAVQIKGGGGRTVAASIMSWVRVSFNYFSEEQERTRYCDYLRDIFGNPFHFITISPSWRSPTVTCLAQEIYTEKTFERMPILADALEDAGCTDTDLLGHLRGPGPHVRGGAGRWTWCWGRSEPFTRKAVAGPPEELVRRQRQSRRPGDPNEPASCLEWF
jgi:hypothetical protein